MSSMFLLIAELKVRRIYVPSFQNHHASNEMCLTSLDGQVPVFHCSISHSAPKGEAWDKMGNTTQ